MSVPVSSLPISQPGAGLVLFSGDPACLTVGLLVGLRSATQAHPLLVVDGANALDPYLLSDLARRVGRAPQPLLASVYISRIFTAYQLEAAVADRLESAVAERRPGAVLLAGLLDTLHHEDLSAAEAWRIFRRVLRTVTRLAAGPLPVVAVCPAQPPISGREAFLPRLAAAAAWAFRVAAYDGRFEIIGEKPASGRWWWEPEIALLAARRWY